MKVNRCSEQVWRGSAFFTGCERRATVKRGGKAFCGTHDPEAVKKRDDARREKWQQKDEAGKLQRNRTQATQVATAAILQIAYEMREGDKRLVRAFEMLIANSDWQAAPLPATDSEAKSE